MENTNPFENLQYASSYTAFIENQVLGLDCFDTMKIDMNGEKPEKLRMTLRYIGRKYGKKFKTKRDKFGDIWVMRVGV